MSKLPPAYTVLIANLDQSILTDAPQDILQHCADWFHARLAEERRALSGRNGSFDAGSSMLHSTRPAYVESQYTFGKPMEVDSNPTNTTNGHRTGRAHAQAAVQATEAEAAEDASASDDGEDQLPVGHGYNYGRRTSVSAESLMPSNYAPLTKTVIPKTPSQKQRIEGSILNNLLFRNLDPDQHEDVINAMKEVKVQAGTRVITQGAIGDFFYVVEQGTFEILIREYRNEYAGPGVCTTIAGEERQVNSVGPGGSFGELALMYNAPRAASVVAKTDGTLWSLDRVTFRSILMEHTSRKRRTYETFLGGIQVLSTLNERERSKISDALEEQVYEENEIVVQEGEGGGNFYIIMSGSAVVSKKSGGVVNTLGVGDYFGEVALLNDSPRLATVRASPHSRLRVATLNKSAFIRLLGPVKDIMARNAAHSYGNVEEWIANSAGAGASAESAAT